ncbi:hypothetical protein MMC34_003822 [Xylographa carneopallida]|nr:hypothetical protein [Xylographa carneopallida]
MSSPLQDTPHPQTLGDIHHSTASMHESSAYQSDDTKVEEGQGLPSTAPADTPLSVSSSPSPNTDSDAPPNASPFKRLTGWRLVVVEACLCLGLLLSIVDSSIVATALVNIEDYFNDFFDVRPAPPPGLNKHTLGAALLGHVDFVGAFLLVISSVLLIIALEEAGAAKESWNSPVIISTLSISGICFLCLIVWILVLNAGMIPITPILPVRLLTHRIMAAAILSTLFTGFPLFLTIIALPERYQIVNGDGATSAGVRMMPLLFASAFGSTLGGLCSSRKNRTFVTLLVASCLMVVGCALLSTASDGLDIQPALYGYQVIFESKFADYSIALGAVNQARIFGGTVGLAASTIILNIRLVNELQGVLSEAQLVELRQSLNYIPSLDPAQQLAVAQSFAKSFNDQLRDCTYVAAACVVISLFTYSRHPTDIVKRKARGEALLAGRITLAEADA